MGVLSKQFPFLLIDALMLNLSSSFRYSWAQYWLPRSEWWNQALVWSFGCHYPEQGLTDKVLCHTVIHCISHYFSREDVLMSRTIQPLLLWVYRWYPLPKSDSVLLLQTADWWGSLLQAMYTLSLLLPWTFVFVSRIPNFFLMRLIRQIPTFTPCSARSRCNLSGPQV